MAGEFSLAGNGASDCRGVPRHRASFEEATHFTLRYRKRGLFSATGGKRKHCVILIRLACVEDFESWWNFFQNVWKEHNEGEQ